MLVPGERDEEEHCGTQRDVSAAWELGAAHSKHVLVRAHPAAQSAVEGEDPWAAAQHQWGSCPVTPVATPGFQQFSSSMSSSSSHSGSVNTCCAMRG